MTRQQLGASEGGAAPRVLLDVRELAGAAALTAASSATEDVQTVVAAFGAQRVAVLQHNAASAPTGFVRLGVFNNAHGDATATRAAASEWVSLWTADETEAAQACVEAKAKTSSEEAPDQRGGEHEDEELKWSLAWSSNGKYVAVTGAIITAQGKREASVWVVSSREWMAIEDAAAEPSPGTKTTPAATESPLLMIRVSLAKHLSTKELVSSAQIATLFFQKSKSNRLFIVTSDGLLVKVDVQVPKLALLTLSSSEAGQQIKQTDRKALFQMKVVKRMGEWHAGVSAAAFEASSGTLVVAGGLKNPSDALVKGRASSLSVWKVLDAEPFCELLDYTMVLSDDNAVLDGGADAGAVSDGDQGLDSEASPAAQNTTAPTGLLQSVKGSIFSPLKFMIGGNSAAASSVLRGSIRQLALSPNGVYVTMLDVQRRVSIRQIDTCSDVVGWQFVNLQLSGRASVADMLEQVDRSSSGAGVKSVAWISADVFVFVLENGRVVYGELARQFEEHGGRTLDDEALSSSPAAPLWKIAMVSVQSHVRRFPAVHEKHLHVEAIAPISSAESTGDAARGYQLLSVDGVSMIQYFENVELPAFVDLLMASHQYDRALQVVEAHGMTGVIDLDAIHRQIWTQFRDLATIKEAMENRSVLLATERVFASNGFSKALHHLGLIRDKSWVVEQCLSVVASDSFAHMKDILGAGLRALMALSESERGIEGAPVHEDETIAVKQQLLLRFIYRLDTLKLLFAEDLLETDELLATHDDADPTRIAEEKYYDGAAFAQFRSASIIEVAKQLACEGRAGSLSVLFQRNAWTIIPRRLEVLSLLPASIAPTVYAHLLPAVEPESRDEWQFYTLRPHASPLEDFADEDETLDDSVGRETRVVEVELQSENKSHDLDADDLALFELKARQSGNERCEEYADWFQTRILEMDSLFGQLANAFQLSSLAKECLRGWQCDSDGEQQLTKKKSEFEAFQRDVERLYNCIYPLQLSSCCLLSLQEWSTLSHHDQILRVVGDWDVATDAIDRIQAVFVAHRAGDTLGSLDDAFSSLCQTLSKKLSLPALELCAQLIHHSNPSMPLVERWIQNDAQLLRTSIDVVYSATTFGYFSTVDKLNAKHSTFVEQLWVIFQSLPVRKEDDAPEIERLQVEVDEMEDLMVTMDVLSKYGVYSSPSELRGQIGEASTTAADDLLQRMCRFSLPGNVSSNDGDGGSSSDAEQWMEVWRDATKLKTHVFGERISQEAILDVILRHLLSHDVYLDAAEHLVTNWIGSNFEVVHHVIVVLVRAIQAKVDTLRGNFVSESELKAHFAALKCIDITKRVLSLASPEGRELDRKSQYERQLRHESELIHACQLLDLLTYGAVKLSPAAIRPLKDAKDRLDVVLKVFTSNPSHYQLSNRARDWFRQHNLEHVISTADGEAGATSPNATPLEAVLYLAKLLRVDDRKHQIVMKGAYAALYCADYDVAYSLTTEVIESIRVAVPHQDGEKSHHSRSDDVELQHLMSLVLDLISASSFRSWSKKLKLCRLVFSAQNVSSTSLFSHQITTLIMSSMQKLDAIDALATELGLSEANIEERRHQDASSKRSSVEELLLKELEVVVDLLQEEKNDRGFLLRLLQRGFQLVSIVLTSAITQQSDESEAAATAAVVLEESQRAERMAQQMSRVCFEGAIAAVTSESNDESASSADAATISNPWRTFLEMGFSYLLLWSDLSADDNERCDLEAFWQHEISPLLASAASSPASAASGDQGTDALVQQCHHFFMLQIASAIHGDDDAEADGGLAHQLRERRKHLETLVESYDETKRFVVSKNVEPEAEGEDDDELGDAEEASSATSRAPPVFSRAKRDVFARLAKQCQDMMLSQKKTQELEEMNSFFNENLDLERFSRDAEYRVSKILMLATTKEHYQVAKQFAAKYGVDEYECLLSYIKSVFLPSAPAPGGFPRAGTSSSSSPSAALNRHEQFEIAFRSENEDFLEQALEKPFVFGHFLLSNGGDSVYESLDGTDHVGILLLLRMVLECSRRIAQLSNEDAMASRVDGSLFPLPKASSDRITLLFMCLKRLKELEPVKRARSPQSEVVNFKLVCAAESCADVLSPPPPTSVQASESRQVAIEALLPFLTGKTIKMLTKILQKLHHVTTSAVVMIYLSDMLEHIWLEQREQSRSSSALAGDLAAYAYEACTPFLSVLTNEHVILFHRLFLGRATPDRHAAAVANVSDLRDEFYGQSMAGFTHFGAFLTPVKRMELIGDTLTLLQTRLEAWRAASGEQQVDTSVLAAKESELRVVENALVEAAFWFIADKVKTSEILFPAATQEGGLNWGYWEAQMKDWFSKDAEQKTDDKQELFGLLVRLCQMVSSVEVASLMVELVLLASSPAGRSQGDPVEATLEHVYRRVFAGMADADLSSDGFGDSRRAVMREWMTMFPDAHSRVSEQFKDLARFIDTLNSGATGKQENKRSNAVYQRILAQLDQFPNIALKQVVESRKSSLQTAAEPQKNAAHTAVVAEWRHLTGLWEQEQKWMQSALLARLVLDSGALSSSEEIHGYEREYFGLQAKAIFGELLQCTSSFKESLDIVFSVPTGQVIAHFGAIFTQALALLSSTHKPPSGERQRSCEVLTTALANMLHFHDNVTQTQQVLSSSISTRHTWELEQHGALTKRMQHQFGAGSLEDTDDNATNGIAEGDESNWWSSLLVHGHWGGSRNLMKWYLGFGYAKITSPRAIEAFAVAHWEAEKHMCVELILVSPFSKLYAHHRDRLLQSVRNSSGSGGDVSGQRRRRVFELLLLRFDVQVLLQAGLYQDLLDLHLNEDAEAGARQNEERWWTSSGEYFVCALVMMKEFATAARLACALWHVHPLLWDYENARLTLANYLKRLATAQAPASDSGDQDQAYKAAVLRRQVYRHTFDFFHRSMTL